MIALHKQVKMVIERNENSFLIIEQVIQRKENFTQRFNEIREKKKQKIKRKRKQKKGFIQ